MALAALFWAGICRIPLSEQRQGKQVRFHRRIRIDRGLGLCTLSAARAQQLSVRIDTPQIGIRIGSPYPQPVYGPVYPAPLYPVRAYPAPIDAPPAVIAPAPVYYPAPPMMAAPPPVVLPAPICYRQPWFVPRGHEGTYGKAKQHRYD
jgi:hypothetical protein